jgi:hypothetical protein
LVCLPTTAGTGSEVSPIAVLLDEADELKKGVVSPHLVPDAAFIDPLLTISVPPAVTAATGLDALTHCIEAYANKFAHPITDVYALRGIKILKNLLLRAVRNGGDAEARAILRSEVCWAACVRPGRLRRDPRAVLSARWKISRRARSFHAVLAPAVLRLIRPPRRSVTRKLRCAGRGTQRLDFDDGGTRRGFWPGATVACRKNFPISNPSDAVPAMAKAAVQVTRLMKNNLRPVTEKDAWKFTKRFTEFNK